MLLKSDRDKLKLKTTGPSDKAYQTTQQLKTEEKTKEKIKENRRRTRLEMTPISHTPAHESITTVAPFRAWRSS